MDLSEGCNLGNENNALMLLLPDAFLEFLEENGLDSSIYAAVDFIPRYISLVVKPCLGRLKLSSIAS